MATPVFVDFNNFEAPGVLRLNCVGTIEDLEATGISLSDGMRLLVWDGLELEADVVVRGPNSNGIWFGEILGDVRAL